MSASYVARQAIYDRQLRTVGYELLFRQADPLAAAAGDDLDPDAATASALVTAVADVGIDVLVGEARAFVNVGRGFILDGLIRVCPPGRVVVEVLEHVVADPDVLEALGGLAADGYRIALDDFVYGPETAPLVPLADIVKIEVDGRSEASLLQELDHLRGFPRLSKLAEKVETREEYECCRRLGFAYYQGYYFSRPQLLEGKVIDPARLSRLELLASLRDENVDPARLERLISRDLGLSHRVLLFVNSAYVGLSRKIGSIREALLLLGFRQLRLFADIVTLADCNRHPAELLVTALVRARMCQQLAAETGSDPDGAFTVGLFSAADALLDMPMAEVVDRLPFAHETKAALAAREGPLGALLDIVLGYEDGTLVPRGGLSVADCERAYLDAVAWSSDMGILSSRRPSAATG